MYKHAIHKFVSYSNVCKYNSVKSEERYKKRYGGQAYDDLKYPDDIFEMDENEIK